MLRIADLTFTLAGKRLFEGASAVLPAGHTIGLVGRNGAGKTTLFRLIRGQFAPESGTIDLPRATRIGGVEQEVPAGPQPLIEIVLAADTERAALMAEADTATDPMRIAEIQTRLADIDAYSAEARAAAILSGLGFDSAAQARPASDFSGGWRMRVALASVLFSAPDLLLLDEPTNYLDLEGTIWLETFLARYPHTALVISHDRALLDRAVKSILHLDRGKLALYSGNYTSFARQRAAKMEAQASAAAKQAERRAHMQAFVDRFRAKATKARQAQSRLKMLEKMETIDIVQEEGVSGFSFPAPEPLSPPIIRLEGASVGYGAEPILKGLNLRIDHDDRIALLGANGQGKSTFSKLIAGSLAAAAGEVTRARKLRIGFFTQHQLDTLNADETPVEHLRRERPDEPVAKLRARLAQGGIGARIAETKVSSLSGGQKARLAMILCTLDAPHLVILDEPTNHLDIESRQALVEALMEYPGAVILVSHDPDLVGAVADRLWLVKDGRVAPFDGDMDDYRKLLLAERGGPQATASHPNERKEARRSAAERRRQVAPLREELAKAEARIDKLHEMLQKIDERLADPALYETADGAKLAQIQKKRGEVEAALAKAEAIWIAVQEKLDAAEAEDA